MITQFPNIRQSSLLQASEDRSCLPGTVYWGEKIAFGTYRVLHKKVQSMPVIISAHTIAGSCLLPKIAI